MHQQVSGGCPAATAHWFACPHKGHCEAVEIGGVVIVGWGQQGAPCLARPWAGVPDLIVRPHGSRGQGEAFVWSAVWGCAEKKRHPKVPLEEGSEGSICAGVGPLSPGSQEAALSFRRQACSSGSV